MLQPYADGRRRTFHGAFGEGQREELPPLASAFDVALIPAIDARREAPCSATITKRPAAVTG